MAKPVTYKGSLIGIYLEDPDTPGTFIKPCGITGTQAQFTKGTQDIDVPDCDDPEAPAWVARAVQSLSFTASGDGVLAADAVPVWWDYFNTTESVEARIYVGSLTDTQNGYYWAGRVHVDQLSVGGTRGQIANVSINVVSDGELVFTKVS